MEHRLWVHAQPHVVEAHGTNQVEVARRDRRVEMWFGESVGIVDLREPIADVDGQPQMRQPPPWYSCCTRRILLRRDSAAGLAPPCAAPLPPIANRTAKLKARENSRRWLFMARPKPPRTTEHHAVLAFSRGRSNPEPPGKYPSAPTNVISPAARLRRDDLVAHHAANLLRHPGFLRRLQNEPDVLRIPPSQR